MIDDEVLHGRHPRLGTITVGRGVEATSRQGRAYSRPERARTLVFHTDDEAVAGAVLDRFGGELVTDSPTWGYDVVTASRSIEVLMLPAGWRQALEHYRAAECLRRCDGVRMSTEQGRPVDKPCACEPEIARGQERACRPVTVLPCIVEVEVERFGVWEIRSNSWGTAAALKGTMRALSMVGVTGGLVPAVVSMVDRTVRDAQRQVHEVVELHATVARSHTSLMALAGEAAELTGAPPPSLPAGDDGDRLDLMQEWSDLQARAHRLGMRARLVDDWRSMMGPGRDFDELGVDELRAWVDLVRATVTDAEDAVRQEATGAPETAGTPPEGEGPGEDDSATPAPAAPASAGDTPPPPDDPWA